MSAITDTVTRVINAKEGFIKSISAMVGCSKTEAEKVFNIYKSNKIIKLSVNSGVWNVVHGAYLEKDVLKRAIALK